MSRTRSRRAAPSASVPLLECVRRMRAGLIKLLDRDEDLLAAVLGHEVAHALARHSTEKLRCGPGLYRSPQGPCVSAAAGVRAVRRAGRRGARRLRARGALGRCLAGITAAGCACEGGALQRSRAVRSVLIRLTYFRVG
jgi:predicted Zn-dependent protease